MSAFTQPVRSVLADENGPTVLVADDFADLRSMVRLCLEERGWKVREAADGAEALDSCRATPPDLVLLDVNMPRLDGWAVLAELQTDSRLRHVPVIMLTTSDGPRSVVDGLERGAHDFMPSRSRRRSWPPGRTPPSGSRGSTTSCGDGTSSSTRPAAPTR